MIITNQNAFRTLVSVIGIILAGIIVTVIIHGFVLKKTSVTRSKLSIRPDAVAQEQLQEVGYQPVEKALTAGNQQVDLEGFKPPANPDAPPPVRSVKSNEIVENLLYALEYYGQVPEEDVLTASVLGWDPESGYYLDTRDGFGTDVYALARNVRHLVGLKMYQKFFPKTKYFDDEAERVEGIVDKIINPDHLKNIFEQEQNVFITMEFPHKVFYDLLQLTEITGDTKYEDAAKYIGFRHSFLTVGQANQMKDNKDRTEKVAMFADAAMTYTYGKMIGNLDLMKDAELVVNELIDELYDERFDLFYTASTIGVGDNVTTTFITRNQMEALLSLVRFSKASGNTEAEQLATRILQSMADGVNPLCDQQRRGFYRRYAGESRSPREDFKQSLDHITYLRAWVELNMLKNGEFNNVLNYEYEAYSNFMYDDTSNAIYARYTMFWQPAEFTQNVPLVSLDAIEDYLVLTLIDRNFRAELQLQGQI